MPKGTVASKKSTDDQAGKHQRKIKPDLDALTRLQLLSGRLLEPEGLQPLLQEIMDVAIDLLRADKGTLQLIEDDSLRIVAHHGHEKPFLEFFESAETRASVCGKAMLQGERVIVTDIEESPLFVGTPSLPILRNAGVRAIQSTPMKTRTDSLLGILTTQWKVPHSPDQYELWLLDLLVRQAADLVEHAKAKEELYENERELAVIFERSIVGKAQIDSITGQFTRVNQALADMMGYSIQELSRVKVDDLIHPEDRQRFSHAFESVRGGRPPSRQLEIRCVRKDGSDVWINFAGNAIQREDQRPAHIIAVIQDITKRRRAEEELQRVTEDLRRSNEDLQHFAAVASHDLQEPLRAVTGFLQVLEERYKEQLDDRARLYIKNAVDGAARMSNLIRDLLEYSKAGHEMEFRPVDSGEVLERALPNLKNAMEEAGAVVTHEGMPTVMANAIGLMQVFQNLILNAMKFRSPGRQCLIHVSATKKGQFWEFSVRDNGIGIDDSDRDRVFLMFQRPGKSDKYPGKGIGLAICRKIVERHGGRIWLESAVDGGATFLFTLPSA